MKFLMTQVATVPQNKYKHFNIKYHHFRVQVQSGTVKVQHVSTDSQIAGIFTKPLPAALFLKHRQVIMGW